MAKLIDTAKGWGRQMVIPLMGFPGIQLNGSTLKQNTFNWGTQFSTVFALERRFHPDGMFFFMDLSVEASALGLPVRFPLDESPSVEEHLVRTAGDLARFTNNDILSDGRVAVFVETMRLMSRYMDTLNGGYVIGPFSLAGLLMGASEAAIASVTDPALLHEVLRFCSGVISRYARALVRAGADMIAILEPSASFLSPALFREFPLRYLQEIMSTLDCVSILHVCGQTTHLLDPMVETGAHALSLDAMVDFPAAVKRIPEDVVLIGNLDTVQVMNQLSPNQVYAAAHELITAMEPYPNFILSSACDLPAETPLENIHAMIDAARGVKAGMQHPSDFEHNEVAGVLGAR
ncbi:MAG: uroporphyrinogen decarboxylase family protein [Chloroflexi bacterium]|nr:uroporphyrinogen decarboxylase family protein [Chloroflexota bacterium]